MESKGRSVELAPDDLTAPPDIGTSLALYRSMVRLRTFEKRAHNLFLEGLVKGTSHLGLGQEAIAAAFGLAMARDDYTFATYRGHNHAIVRGVPMGAVMAELMGRENGLMAGKGGSMHLTSTEHYMMGSYAIVGAHLTIANGAAWSAKLRGTGQVAVCFFGDGATNIGTFHEALNFAVVFRLPIVFVCENNLYMEYTPISTVTGVEHPAADRAAAYGLPSILVDGNDVDIMLTTARSALERARNEGKPSLIEAQTYRHGGHSRADPGKYRPDDEVADWLGRDPVLSYRDRLVKRHVDEAVLDEVDKSELRAVDNATEEAVNGASPSLHRVCSDVFADGGSTWRK